MRQHEHSHDLAILRTTPDGDGNYPANTGGAAATGKVNVFDAAFENPAHFDPVQGPQARETTISNRQTFVANRRYDSATEFLPPHTRCRGFKQGNQWWTSALQPVSWLKVAAADGSLVLWGHQPIKTASGVIRPPLAEGASDTGKLYVGGGAVVANSIYSGIGRWEREQIENSWAAKWLNNADIDEANDGTAVRLAGNATHLFATTATVLQKYDWDGVSQWTRDFSLEVFPPVGTSDCDLDSTGKILTCHEYAESSAGATLLKTNTDGTAAWGYPLGHAESHGLNLEVAGDDTIRMAARWLEAGPGTMHYFVDSINADGTEAWSHDAQNFAAFTLGRTVQCLTIDATGKTWICAKLSGTKEVWRFSVDGATRTLFTVEAGGNFTAIHCDRSLDRLYIGGSFVCTGSPFVRNELRRYDLSMNLEWRIPLPFSPLWIDTDEFGEVYCGGIAQVWMKQPVE